MSGPAICGNCRFFLLGTTKGFPEAQGMCRRHAPRGPALGDGRWQVFPPMSAGQWCGEHVLLRGAALAGRYEQLDAWLNPERGAA